MLGKFAGQFLYKKRTKLSFVRPRLKIPKEGETIQSNLWKIYLYKILEGMYFAVPIIVLYYQSNGITLAQIMILQSFCAVLIVILEIPTGYFADIHGRKKALIIASFTAFIGISIYAFATQFIHFLFAQVFFAFTMSLTSGTVSALVYDTLKSLGEEAKYKKIWGNMLFYGVFVVALSSILGGFLGNIDLRYPLYATLPFYALMIPVAFLVQEPKMEKRIFKSGYVKELLNILKLVFLENKKLRWILVYSGILFAFTLGGFWFYQPYLELTGLNIAYFGIVFAGFQVISAFSSKYAYKIEEKIGKKSSLVGLVILLGLSYLFMSNFIFLFSFLFCFLQKFVEGFKEIVVTERINSLTEPNIRATVLSVESFVGRLIYALIIPVIGWAADLYSIEQALAIMGITTLVSGLVIVLILKKNEAL